MAAPWLPTPTNGCAMTRTLLTGQILTAPVNLNHPGRYVHWGVVQISVANLAVIAIMLMLFLLALVLPFPGTRRRK